MTHEVLAEEPGRFTRLRHAVRSDTKSMTLPKKALVFADLTMKAYEWGPGNETLTPFLAANLISEIDNPKDALVAGLVTGAFTTAQQATSALLTTGVMEFAPLTTEELSKELKKISPHDNHKPYKELNPYVRFIYPFTLGSSFVALRERLLVKKDKLKDVLYPAIGASALVGTSVGAMTTLAGIGKLESVDTALETTVDKSIELAENPLLWLGTATVVMAYPYLKNRFSKN